MIYSGWFKIHREIFEKAIWKCSTPEQKVILLTILGMVNFKDNQWEWNGKKFDLKAGQMITSLESIVEETGDKGKRVSIQNVRTALAKFEKVYRFLTNESTKQGRLIIVLNWGFYQGDEEDTNKAPNRQLTDDQQTANKQLTTIEEGKEDKKVKKDNKKKPKVFDDSSNEYKLSVFLFNHIKKVNSSVKEPKFQNWAKKFDEILRIDQRPLEEVKRIIKNTFQDVFWFKNIQSPTSLKKNYSKLFMIDKTNKPTENKITGSNGIPDPTGEEPDFTPLGENEHF